jgi:antitoxin component of RelBE/YafQ-DinJ toxin-antitoxin module
MEPELTAVLEALGLTIDELQHVMPRIATEKKGLLLY